MTPPCALKLDDETLSAWRDQQLPPARMRQIDAHVADCAACRQRLASFERIARDLTRLPMLSPGDRIVTNVLSQIAAQEHPAMTTRTRSLQRGVGAIATVALVVAFAVIFALVLRNHTPASTGVAASTATARPVATPTHGPPSLTSIVSVTQAWGANAATVVTPHLDPQHYFQTNGVSADGQALFGTSITNMVASKGGVTTIPGTYGVATGHFTPYAIQVQPGMAPAVNCCQVSSSYAIISQNTQPGATCGVCHTIYYSVELATGTIRLLTPPAGTSNGIASLSLSADHALIIDFDGVFRLLDLHTDTYSVPPGPPLSLQEDVVAFTWPYLAYTTQQVTQGTPYPNTIILRDLRSGAEVTLTAPKGTTAAAFAQPFSTNPGTPQPSPTPPAVQTGFLSATITGDTLFFTSQSYSFTTLYEVDHMMTAGAAQQPIARLPNPHDGTLASTLGANDRLVLVATGTPSGANGALQGQDLAFDRVQGRFVDLLDYNDGTNDYDSFSFNGQTLLQSTIPAIANTPGADTIFDTATLPTNG